ALNHVAKSKLCPENQYLSLRRSLRRLLMRFIQKQVIQSKNTVIKNMSSHWQIIMLSINIDCLLI
ncbi:hypothetical protein LG832_004078, partial [Acinetobacter baumannii]